MVYLQGKGIMLTYWVLGKQPNNGPQLNSTHTLITTTGVELLDGNHELSNSKQTEFPATNDDHDLMELDDTEDTNRKISLPGNVT